MEIYQLIEYSVIGFIIILQVVVFSQIARKMNFLKTAIPFSKEFRLVKGVLPLSEEFLTIRQVIDFFANHYNEGHFGKADIWEHPGEKITGNVSLIQSMVDMPFINKIIYNLNTYLIKNKGAAADFHLIKDLVERNVELEEQEIDVLTPIPLYLGLGGTMFGIIIGLFGMPSVSGEFGATSTELGIDSLINGVKIAMIASFTGLVFTTYSSWKFKIIKSAIETRKNEFYTFIQSQLLPVLSKSIQSTAQALKTDFAEFNDTFSSNIKELKTVVRTNVKAFQLQNETLQKLENIDVNKLANANIMTFQHLQQSMEDLEKLGTYILSMREFIDSTTNLGERVNEVLDRTNMIGEVANEVKDVFEQHKKLNSFLYAHFDELEKKGDNLQTALSLVDGRIKSIVADASSNSKRTADEYENYIAEIIRASRESLINQYAELERITLKNPEHFKNLEYLEKLNRNLEEYLKKAVSVHDKMIKRLESIEKNTLSTSRKVSTSEGKMPLKSFYDLLPLSVQRFIPYFEFGYAVIKFSAVILFIIVLIQLLLPS